MANQQETYFSSDTTADLSAQFNYDYVNTIARVARYDDFHSAPQISEVAPAQTTEFIENLTIMVYSQAQQMGGKIPYTVIREVSENFIHAQFKEIVVSIYDQGNTIRFADQGPGIEKKEKAQLPGYSSAIAPMKKYIRGVGSGLPIVKDYLDFSHGSISIEDNLLSGAVITISLSTDSSTHTQTAPQAPVHLPKPALSAREQQVVYILQQEESLGVSDISELLNFPASSTYNILVKLEELGIVEKTLRQKRQLTEYGKQVALSLS